MGMSLRMGGPGSRQIYLRIEGVVSPTSGQCHHTGRMTIQATTLDASRTLRPAGGPVGTSWPRACRKVQAPSVGQVVHPCRRGVVGDSAAYRLYRFGPGRGG